MNQPSSVVCLSLAPNLRCVSLNPTQFDVLIIPPAIELVFCVLLICLQRGSGRAHLLLAADSVLYFILALFDLLSHIIPAARSSITAFKAMNIFIGSVSFVPMLFYASYLFWLSHRDFITSLPPRYQSIPKYLLMILIPVVVAVNEVASFVGVSIRRLPDSQPSFMFDLTNNNGLPWLNLSQLSLALYTAFQMLSFFLAFYRLGKAFLDQQRIEKTHADERHYFNGIGWITVGIKLGAIESIVGFAMGGFAVPFSRRILRLFSRSSLIIGVLKGMDVRENFEYLTDELASWRRSSNLHPFVTNKRMSLRASQFPFLFHEPSPTEKVVKGNKAAQRVTVHHERGQAPFLQIRFSKLNLPEQAVVMDDIGGQTVQWQRRSYIYVNSSPICPDQKISGEIPAPRHSTVSYKGNVLRESGQTISDSMSVIRELTLRFPLPPRVTGKYRGSVLGQKHSVDDDERPLVGIPREANTRRDIEQLGENGAATGNAALSTSGSIKRKPAPPLLPLPKPTYTRAERPVSSWGGLASKNNVEYAARSPVTPTSSNNSTGNEGWSTPQSRLRQLTPRRLFDRASRNLSIASIRSAEWLSSALSQPSSHPHLTPARIEAYYSGGSVISPRRASDPGDMVASGSGGEPSGDDWRKSTGDTALAGTSEPQLMSIGQVPTKRTPTPTLAPFSLRREPITSIYGEVQIPDWE